MSLTNDEWGKLDIAFEKIKYLHDRQTSPEGPYLLDRETRENAYARPLDEAIAVITARKS